MVGLASLCSLGTIERESRIVSQHHRSTQAAEGRQTRLQAPKRPACWNGSLAVSELLWVSGPPFPPCIQAPHSTRWLP